MDRKAEAGVAGRWKARLLVAIPRDRRGRGAAARKAGVEALMAAIFQADAQLNNLGSPPRQDSALGTKGRSKSSRPRKGW